jgi:hypothetical protein
MPSRSTIRRVAAPLALATLLAPGLLATPAVADAPPIFEVEFTQPSADRWNYPFNSTPGTRWTASVFGNEAGSPLFDNRDGQMVIAFDTEEQIASGLGVDRYEVLAIRLHLRNAVDGTWLYSTEVEPWQSFLPSDDPRAIPDPAPGEPIELFGTGFRSGFSPLSWQENSPFGFGDPLAPGIRVAYAMTFDGAGAPRDVSNSVRGEFTPQPWAVGTIADLKLGQPVPYDAEVSFEVDLSIPGVADYFAEALDRGRLLLSVTSMARVVQQGSAFPAFHCKESPLVQLGITSAARLEVVMRTFGAPPRPADINGDCVVDGADLAILLGNWGTAGPGDLDGDGVVGGADLAILLQNWG